MKSGILFAAIGLLAVTTVYANCPNACSGHGVCGEFDACTCDRRWMSNDCSERVCAYGSAWVTTPQGDLNADGDLNDNSRFPVKYTSAGAAITWGASYQQNVLTATAAFQGSILVGDYVTIEGDKGRVVPAGSVMSESFRVTAVTTTQITIAGQIASLDGYSKAKLYRQMNTPKAPAAWESWPGDYAADQDEGHFYMECSNRGLCDRKTGNCACFDGYSGTNCGRATCPNSCSGHGVCRSVSQLGALAPVAKAFTATSTGGLTGTKVTLSIKSAGLVPGDVIGFENVVGKFTVTAVVVGETAAAAGAAGAGWAPTDVLTVSPRLDAALIAHAAVTVFPAYALWDAAMSRACSCDAGFDGYDCSKKSCPKGDDPLTTNQKPEVQFVEIGRGAAKGVPVGGTFRLTFNDVFGDKWTTGKINAYGSTDYGADVKAALEALPTAVSGVVTVTKKVVGATIIAGAGDEGNVVGMRDLTVSPGIRYAITFTSLAGDLPMLGCDASDLSFLSAGDLNNLADIILASTTAASHAAKVAASGTLTQQTGASITFRCMVGTSYCSVWTTGTANLLGLTGAGYIAVAGEARKITACTDANNVELSTCALTYAAANLQTTAPGWIAGLSSQASTSIYMGIVYTEYPWITGNAAAAVSTVYMGLATEADALLNSITVSAVVNSVASAQLVPGTTLCMLPCKISNTVVVASANAATGAVLLFGTSATVVQLVAPGLQLAGAGPVTAAAATMLALNRATGQVACTVSERFNVETAANPPVALTASLGGAVTVAGVAVGTQFAGDVTVAAAAANLRPAAIAAFTALTGIVSASSPSYVLISADFATSVATAYAVVGATIRIKNEDRSVTGFATVAGETCVTTATATTLAICVDAPFSAGTGLAVFGVGVTINSLFGQVSPGAPTVIQLNHEPFSQGAVKVGGTVRLGTEVRVVVACTGACTGTAGTDVMGVTALTVDRAFTATGSRLHLDVLSQVDDVSRNIVVSAAIDATELAAGDRLFFPNGDSATIKVVGSNSLGVVLESPVNFFQPDSALYKDGKGTRENGECSTRGLCDSTTGTCKCFKGYTGLACDAQNALSA